MSNKAVLQRPRERAPYQPFGAARTAWMSARTEILMSGPANTGKSRGLLEKLHYCTDKYPGIRSLMVRKTRKSLTQSAMVTYEKKVLPQGWMDKLIHFNTSDQQYEYPNGSIIAVSGLDDPQKVMSSEWDLIYVNEATELSENDWEMLCIRRRNKAMRYQQLMADCNPGPPTHWLKKRCDRGKTLMLESRHCDNPAFTKDDQQTLDDLTGVRRKRYRDGIWAAAEGMVYEDEWNPAVHIIDRFAIPSEWDRYWVLDWGFRNPFVWQAWAQDHDGTLYRYHEIYRTGVLVEDMAKEIMEVTAGEPRPVAIICDHDAEDRATFERHTDLHTTSAKKAVSTGIQAVKARLRVERNGRAGMYFLRDSLIGRDAELDKKSLPTCTETEFESYVWNTEDGRKVGEEPVKKFDHGQDCNRYLINHIDGGAMAPLHGDEPTDEPVPVPTIAEIQAVNPFDWLSEHGGWDD